MRTERVDVGAVTLAVDEAGAGGRPLLLVHGFGGARQDFADFVDQLAGQGWHVVAPDLRGHGDSDKPADEAAYGFDIFIDDLVALVDHLGWPHFALLGHSMGGMVAQRLALRHPDRLDALVLMDTSHAPPDGLDPALVELAVTVLRDEGAEEFHRLSKLANDPLASPAHARVVRERPGYEAFCDAKSLGASREMRLAMFPQFLVMPDLLDRLAGLDLPVLVLVGEQDQAFIGHAQRMAAAIPGARLEVIAGAGHSPQFESPAEWWAALSDFLDSLPDAEEDVA